MDSIPINLALMKHPMNWIIVFLMVLLPLTVLAVVDKQWHAAGAGN